MLPLPILLAFGAVGVYLLFSPAAPWSGSPPSQGSPASPPSPTPTPAGALPSSDAEPPFVPGFNAPGTSQFASSSSSGPGPIGAVMIGSLPSRHSHYGRT
jgi:hypothetical protein